MTDMTKARITAHIASHAADIASTFKAYTSRMPALPALDVMGDIADMHADILGFDGDGEPELYAHLLAQVVHVCEAL